MNEQGTSHNLRKYTSGNPALRYLIGRFQARCARLLEPLPAGRALEVGCGEGFLLRYLEARFPAWRWAGCDLDPVAIDFARQMLPDLPLAVGDICALDQPDAAFDLVIASEVLEHLDNPAAGLRELLRVTRRHLLLSVPDEPLFRLSNFLRGKYLATWGNHPEHVQHWNLDRFRAFVGEHARVVIAETCYPWLIVLAEKHPAASEE